MHFEDCLKTIEVRSKIRSMRKVRETKFFYIITNFKGQKINVHTVIEQAYNVFDYA